MKKILLLLFTLSLFSCGILNKQGKNTHKNTKLPENHEQLLNLTVSDQFLEGKRAVYTGDFVKALAHFTRCIKDNPKHAASMFEISRIYEVKQDYKESTKWAKKAYLLSETNVWYLKNYIEQLKKSKDYVETASMLKKLIELEPKDKQHYYDLANAYIYHQEFASALSTYKRIEDKFGFEEGVVLQRKQIYLNQNKLKEALAEVELLISHYPNETKYYGMKGHILNMQGKYDEALDVYNYILKIDPQDGKVHLALSTLYLSKGENDKAYNEEQLAFANESLSIDHKVSAIMKYFKKEQLGKQDESQLLSLLNILVEKHPNEAKVYAVYGDYLIRKKQDELALKQYEKALSLDSTKYLIWEQVILIYNSVYDYQSVQTYCRKALGFFPQHSALYYFSALSANELGLYDVSIQDCEIGMNFTYKPAQQIDFLLLSGKSYASLEKYEDAILQYEQVSYIKANFPEALAEQAYCMAMSDKDLAAAEQYIKSALELEANNQRYYFIYATILSKQNNFSVAKFWIDKAIDNSSAAMHYELAGDIYASLKDNSLANKFYKMALDLNGNKSRIELKMSKLSL